MELWKDFKAPASLIKKNDWVDRPSVGIPYLYVSTGVLLYEALQQQGKTKEAMDVLAEAKKIASATQLQDFFGPETAAARRTRGAVGRFGEKDAVPVEKQPANRRAKP